MRSHRFNSGWVLSRGGLLGAVAAAGACVHADRELADASPSGERTTMSGDVASLMIRIEVADAKGAVMVALFDDAAAYDGGGAPVRATRAAASDVSMSVRFDGLPAGDYAIRAFHDLNGDGELNTNPFGLPTEPFAFSNGAQARFGPPPFDAARIVLAPGDNAEDLKFGK